MLGIRDSSRWISLTRKQPNTHSYLLLMKSKLGWFRNCLMTRWKASVSRKLGSKSCFLWCIEAHLPVTSRIRILRLQQKPPSAPSGTVAAAPIVLNVMKTTLVWLSTLFWSCASLDTPMCLASECRREREMSTMQSSVVSKLSPRKIRWWWDTILLSNLLWGVCYSLIFLHHTLIGFLLIFNW